MAVDVCSEIVWSCGSSPGISPRISFSHDLKGCEHVPVETGRLTSDSDHDFDFCVTASSNLFPRPADELFYDGKILPVPMIEKESRDVRPDQDPQKHRSVAPLVPLAEKRQLKELLLFDPEEESPRPRPATKSLWNFSRSSSLNCESLRSKGLMKSLQFLARSNSTGSVLNGNPDSISRGNPKKCQQQQPCMGRRSVSSSRRSSVGWASVSPVLNFQPPVCIGNVGLFGIGSFFCSPKLKNKTKKKKKA